MLQSIVFDRNLWSLGAARTWLRKHNYKLSFYGKDVDITRNSYRFRQRSPSRFKRFRSKEIMPGIIFIFGFNEKNNI